MAQELDEFQKNELLAAKESGVDIIKYTDGTYDWLQLEEIRLGLEQHLDVSVYADNKYIYLQMQQIRKGLEHGLAVNYYANEHYDWMQMEEIRLGLEAKIEVSSYATVEYDYLIMRELRKGLMAGINLLPYVKKGYPTEIIRQVRKARGDHIDLEEYVLQGYDCDQLEQIRRGIKSNISYREYTNISLSGSQMKEIRIGLEKGLDTSLYNNKELNWMQMREVRMGLEKELDIFWYNDKNFSSRQMREIRLGLEAGQPVVEYAMYIWSATDMHQKRIFVSQEEESDTETYSDSVQFSELEEYECIMAKGEDGVRVCISKDAMSAMLLVPKPQPEKSYTEEELTTILSDCGVKYGISQDQIKQLIAQNEYDKPVEVARGKKSQNGKDGVYQILFNTDLPKVPKVLEDGSVDYKNIKLFETVKKGQKLAIYTPATYGVYGYTVKGTILSPVNGKNLQKLQGKGFVLMDDGVTYTARFDGRVEYKNYELQVIPIYVVEGDVTGATGNIRFAGDVYVKGSVGSGATIEAQGDITVSGNVEAATIRAGKNVLLMTGACGSHHGVIQAGEKIYGKYFEEVTLVAEGNIETNYLLNCESISMESIIVSGRKGAIVGGNSYAIAGVEAQCIGNVAELATNFELGKNHYFEQRITEWDKKIDRMKHELSAYMMEFKRLLTGRKREDLEKLTTFQNIRFAMMQKQKEFEQLNQEKEKFVQKVDGSKNVVQIIVSGTAYPGCKIKIDDRLLYLRGKVQSVIFKKKDNNVVIFSLTGIRRP